MEKILQILVVFALIMLAVTRFIRGKKQKKYRDYVFRHRKKELLLPDVSGRLLQAFLVPLNGEPGFGTFFNRSAAASPQPAIDEENQLSFRRSETDSVVLEVFDERTGLRPASLTLGYPVDGILFDPETRLIYCCSAESTLYIIHQRSKTEYGVFQAIAIPRGCTGLAIDPKSKTLFLQSDEYYYVFEPE